jgi:two-component system, chemotaxis family, chemotaxis protein CheY
MRIRGRDMKSYDISKLNILVLEKHVLVRKLLTEVFKEFGVPTVHSTADPEMAWQIFDSTQIDIILSDWSQDLDGVEFLNRVRNDHSSTNPYAPFIVVTAHSDAGNICLARDMGMTEFLAKPVSPQMIYSRIVSVIENQRPFIRMSDFFGPDRRRKFVNLIPGNDRRKKTG